MVHLPQDGNQGPTAIQIYRHNFSVRMDVTIVKLRDAIGLAVQLCNHQVPPLLRDSGQPEGCLTPFSKKGQLTELKHMEPKKACGRLGSLPPDRLPPPLLAHPSGEGLVDRGQLLAVPAPGRVDLKRFADAKQPKESIGQRGRKDT